MEKSRVLVVGDTYSAAHDVAKMMRAAGDLAVNVVAVKDALQTVKKASPDLIVVDVAPGDALESLQVAEKLRAGLDDPVIYLVSADDALLLQRAGITAPHGYLLKPVRAPELRGAIEVALYRHNIDQRLAEYEASYRGLFEDAPFSVWEEDFSAVKIYLDELRATGVDDLECYLHDNPDVVEHCASLVKILNVNQAAVELFGAADKASLLKGLGTLFVEQSWEAFADELVAFSRWQRRLEREIVGRKLNGKLVDTLFQATLVSGYEETWGKVFITATDITARKHAQAELVRERQLLRAVVDNLPDAVYTKDLQGRKTLANRADLDNMGIATEEEVLGKTDFDIFPSEVATHFDLLDRQVFSTGQQQLNYEEYLCNQQGRCVWLLSSKLPLKDAAGQVVGLLGIARDITERKRAEEERRRAEIALKRSAATLRSIFRAAPIGIGLVSNRVLLQVNDRICELTGYTQAELVGKSARILYPTDEDFDYVGREKYGQIREHGAGTVETRWQRKDGQILDVWLSSTPLDPADLSAGVTFTALDITERKQAEEERERLLQQVQEQTRQMQQIMDTVPEGVLLLDAELRLLLCNPSAMAYLPVLTDTATWEAGQTLTALGGQPIAELLSPPPHGLWHEVVEERRHFQVLARAIETGPMMGGWVLVLRDVTEEYAIRETVQRQDRLATVGQLAAGIAHDFNNILAGIVLYSQMSLRTPDLPPQLHERLVIIANQAHRAADLINQILDFSRSTVLDRLPLDLVPLLKEQVKLWERTLPESIRVDFTYGSDNYTIDADPTRMQQVFMNLVVNARDAMPDGGILSIEVTRLRVTKPKYAPLPDVAVGEWVQVMVSDTGSGIPEEVLPYIYDPFFTTKPEGKGTGLGLSQVYGIVSSHDGFVDVHTEVDVGTTFLLYFPALEVPELPPVVMFDDLPLGHGETILVVEDNAAAREAIVASLELLNYHVLEAENGKVALKVFAEHRKDIALVLSDLVMAEMGGKALAQALYQHDPTLRVVVMTGHPLNEEREMLREAGVVAWIQKPPELGLLAETLARACSDTPSFDI
ncbi:MAG: PAS domain S-box protein [Anaerolineae bacterium]